MAYGNDAGGGGGGDAREHNAPCSNRDFDFFYLGLEDGQLLAQRCGGCGTLRTLPSPTCSSCRSFDWEAVPLSGKGRIHSWVIHHYPPLPGFETPHPIAVVDLDEGVRFVGAMDGTPAETLAADRPVTVEFLRRGDVAAYRFKLD